MTTEPCFFSPIGNATSNDDCQMNTNQKSDVKTRQSIGCSLQTHKGG